MIATLAWAASVAKPFCTSLGTRASHGRSTIGASVPSISKASNVLGVRNARVRAIPAEDNAYLTLLHLDVGGALMRVDAFGDALALAQPRGIEQHRSRPAVDVEFLHQSSHAAHAHPLLIRGHRQGTEKGMRTLLAVIRIDEQRVVQLPGRAGELRKHEHSLLVIAGGDELLGDQVHAVVEARHHAGVPGPTVLVDDRRLMVLDLEPDRLPATAAKTRVDAARQRSHSPLEVLILV